MQLELLWFLFPPDFTAVWPIDLPHRRAINTSSTRGGITRISPNGIDILIIRIQLIIKPNPGRHWGVWGMGDCGFWIGDSNIIVCFDRFFVRFLVGIILHTRWLLALWPACLFVCDHLFFFRLSWLLFGQRAKTFIKFVIPESKTLSIPIPQTMSGAYMRPKIDECRLKLMARLSA